MSEKVNRPETLKITEQDRVLVDGILEKLHHRRQNDPSVVLVNTDELSQVLSEDELSLVNRVLYTTDSPKGLPELGITELDPSEMVVTNATTYIVDGEERTKRGQYLPRDVFEAYVGLDIKMFQDTGRHLIVAGGYRSPAYQAILLLAFLKQYEYDMDRTLQRVALPSQSEHCQPHTAIDFMTIDGSPNESNPQSFANTPEGQWLAANAAHLGFTESYPEDNTFGIMPEPWHYRPEAWILNPNNL